MGIGLKKSKVAIFSIDYELYPESGSAEIKDEYDDYYIAGIGLDYLPWAEHDDEFVEEINDNLTVYLQNQNSLSDPTWNKTNINGVFSNPITKISDTEADDLNLKAKWSQYLYKGDNTYDPGYWTQEAVKLNDEATIFNWNESK